MTIEARRFEARATFRVTAEALWPLVSDTARMNRAIGSPPVVYTITPVESGGSRIEAEVQLFGLSLARYTEHPFRWEAPREFVVVREFHAGPLLRVRAGARLAPVEGGTEVVIFGDFVPRNALGVLVSRVLGPRSVRLSIEQCRDFERYLLGEADEPFPRLVRRRKLPGRSAGAAERLVAHGFSQQAVEVLRRHLAEAPDEDVVRMRPFALADRWGLDRRETLGLFLHATVAGLLEMSWDVLCPNCRIGQARYPSLGDLAAQAHCATCNITFDAAFDRAVEVRFGAAPDLRRIEQREYCLEGPMNTPHIVAQVSVGPGQVERLHCELSPGPYRLRVLPDRGHLMITATGDNGRPTMSRAEARDGASSAAAGALAVTIRDELIEPLAADVPPGPLGLEVLNATAREQLVVVEGSLWPDTVLTAATVCSTQEFRDLFAAETLAPGLQLGLENLVFLFVELAGGSGPDHAPPPLESGLEVVRRAIGGHGGALVRGADRAVMATFRSGRDALAAALQIQRELRVALPGAGSQAEIGLHQGPCVAVNLDGRLDYSGRAVETAAALQRESGAGQIVASQAVVESPGASALLRTAGATIGEEVLRPPGPAEPVPIYRITPLVGEAPAAAEPGPAGGPRGSVVLREWLALTRGPLVFDYHESSYAGERIEATATAYAEALERIGAFLGRDLATLPPIGIRLLDLPPNEGAASELAGRDGLEAWVVVTPESPGPPPELILTPLVLEALFGPGQPLGRFWEDGLAGYLAVQAGSAEHAEAPGRVLKLQEQGQVQSLLDEVQQRAERNSPHAALVATAFSLHLISWRGHERFLRLLRAARAGRADAFRQVYGQPLQAAETHWLRRLEAGSPEARGTTLNVLRDLLPYFRTYRFQLAAIVVTVLFGLSFDLFTPLALRFLIDDILGRKPLGFTIPGVGAMGERIEPDQQIPTLLKLLGVMVGMFLVNAATRIRQTELLATVSEGVTLDLRRRFFDHLQRLPVSFHARTSTTDLSQRFFTDIGQVPAALSIGLTLTSNGLAMAMFGSTMLSLNLWLGLLAIAGLPFFALSARRGRVANRQASRERGRRASEIQQALFENLAAQRFLRLRNARTYVVRRFDERLEIHRFLNIRTMLLTQALARATGLITNAAQVAVLVVGGLIVIVSSGQQLSPGGLMAFYLLLLRLYLPAGSFAGAIQSLELAADGLTRLRKVLDQSPEAEPPGAVSLEPLRQALILREVQLVQPNGRVELKGLTAEVSAGAKVAFVGPTGSGKPSLLTLLSRLDDPTGGEILWDGTDLMAATRDSLRHQVTVLLQDTFVLRTTLYDNIRLGRPEAGELEVLTAARTSGLHEFVMSLPSRYDTVVSDRDPLLTGPVRQRLAVAQALLREASVVVMEDATGALDASIQRELEVALRGPDGRRTLISVTQRLSAIADADRIYVLDDGRVVECGTHDELMERRGLYVQLLRDEMGEMVVSGARQAIRRLSKLVPFSSLPAEVLEQAVKLLLFMEREPGQEIVHQGSVGDELFIVGRGELEVVVADEQGQERLLNVLGEGDYFGEISFLRRAPRTATVRARTMAELHVLRRLDFDQLLAQLDAGMLTHLEATARARLDDTRAKLAALTADGPVSATR